MGEVGSCFNGGILGGDCRDGAAGREELGSITDAVASCFRDAEAIAATVVKSRAETPCFFTMGAEGLSVFRGFAH